MNMYIFIYEYVYIYIYTYRYTVHEYKGPFYPSEIRLLSSAAPGAGLGGRGQVRHRLRSPTAVGELRNADHVLRRRKKN